MSCPRCDGALGRRGDRVPRAFYKNGQATLLTVCWPCEQVLDFPKVREPKTRSDS